MINLVDNIIDKDDIKELIKWLETDPKLTKGELTKEFEKKWSEWLGVKYSVFVNSGSSANLLMIYSMISQKLLKNKKVIIPTLSWATSIAPLLQFDLDPILCDCNMNNISIDIDHFEKLCKEYEPSALMLIHPLGMSTDMIRIQNICKKYGRIGYVPSFVAISF